MSVCKLEGGAVRAGSHHPARELRRQQVITVVRCGLAVAWVALCLVRFLGRERKFRLFPLRAAALSSLDETTGVVIWVGAGMPAGRSKHDGPDMDVKSVDGLDKVLRDLLRFLSAPISRELDNPQWYQIMTVFEAWDAAGDVDRAEFVHGMAVLGIELDTPEVESVFATFGRGSSGMLDVSELSAALSTHKDKQEAEDKEKPEPGRVRRPSKLVGQAVKQALPPPHPHPHPRCPLPSGPVGSRAARLGGGVGRPAKAWSKHLPPRNSLRRSSRAPLRCSRRRCGSTTSRRATTSCSLDDTYPPWPSLPPLSSPLSLASPRQGSLPSPRLHRGLPACR